MEEKDLTCSANQRKEGFKMVVRANGLLEKVPYHAWRAEMFKNPLGETAQRALREKDPDLDKIKISSIPLKTFMEVPIVDVKGKTLDVSPPIACQQVQNLKTETAKRIGFRRAEEGKSAR